jgi:hypothetical protein
VAGAGVRERSAGGLQQEEALLAVGEEPLGDDPPPVVDRHGLGELDVRRARERGEVVLLAARPEQRGRLVARLADDPAERP